MNIRFFPDQQSLRTWFERNHRAEIELLIGYYKVKTGKKSVTWSQSVDEALCFGWIDGIRRSIDAESYCIRFTPRRPGSNWSALNIRKVEELTRLGFMLPEGLEAFSKRKDAAARSYSYESMDQAKLSKILEGRFHECKQAWHYFMSETPSYRRITIRWIMSARQETTRLNRLQELITASDRGERIKAMQARRKPLK